MISFIYRAACCQLLLVAILKSQILYIYKTPNCIIKINEPAALSLYLKEFDLRNFFLLF